MLGGPPRVSNSRGSVEGGSCKTLTCASVSLSVVCFHSPQLVISARGWFGQQARLVGALSPLLGALHQVRSSSGVEPLLRFSVELGSVVI